MTGTYLPPMPTDGDHIPDSSNPEPASPIPTVKELDDLVTAIFAQRKVVEEKEEALSEENKKLAAMELKAANWLEETGREKYQHPSGTVYFLDKWSFSLPKTDEDKAAFFGWLREKGIFDKYATVHSVAYNSLIQAEWEIAKKNGGGMDFKVPGVPEPTFRRTLRTLKGRS